MYLSNAGFTALGTHFECRRNPNHLSFAVLLRQPAFVYFWPSGELVDQGVGVAKDRQNTLPDQGFRLRVGGGIGTASMHSNNCG
jgi:hypothetical protein